MYIKLSMSLDVLGLLLPSAFYANAVKASACLPCLHVEMDTVSSRARSSLGEASPAMLRRYHGVLSSVSLPLISQSGDEREVAGFQQSPTSVSAAL